MHKKYLTLLNVIASFAVVALHVNHVFWNYSAENYWFTSNIIESIFYFAVPVFFMLSGANLLDYSQKYSHEEYAIKRIDKTVIPFFMWTSIGSIYINYFSEEKVLTNFVVLIPLILMIITVALKEHLEKFFSHKIIGRVVILLIIVMLAGYTVSLTSLTELSMKEVTEAFLFTKIVNSYWFFIPLFSIYISIPILEQIKVDSRERFFKWAIVGIFFVSFAFPFLLKTLFNIEYNPSLELPLIQGALWYFLVGYYVDRYGENIKYRGMLYLSGILSLLIIIIGTQMDSLNNGMISMLYKGYYNLPTILYSSAIFVFIKSIPHDLVKKFDKLLNFIAPETFGIYLIHWMVIPRIEEWFNLNPYSILYRTFGSVLVFAISLFLVKIIKRIPLIKVILP